MANLLFYLTDGTFDQNYHSYETTSNEEITRRKVKKFNNQVNSFILFLSNKFN
jgi:hypothetical protein